MRKIIAAGIGGRLSEKIMRAYKTINGRAKMNK